MRSKPQRFLGLGLMLGGLTVGGCADGSGGAGASFGPAGVGVDDEDEPRAVSTGVVDDEPAGSTGGDGSTGGPSDPETGYGESGRDPSGGSTSYGPGDTYGSDTDYETTDGHGGSTTGEPDEPHCCSGLQLQECLEQPACEWAGGKNTHCTSVCEGSNQMECSDNPLCYWVGTEARICAPGDGNGGQLDCNDHPGS